VKELEILTDEEKEGLHRIRLTRRVMWALIFSFPVVAFGSSFITQSEKVFDSIWVIWAAGILVCAVRIMFVSCPRCGQFFHMWWFFANPWARRCMHCGLRLRRKWIRVKD
jgi:hypothetical protein